MGVYWRAYNHVKKEYIDSPEGFAIKFPGIFHVENPFPHILVYAMLTYWRGCPVSMENDMDDFYYENGYKDISRDIYKSYREEYGITN